MKKYVLPKKVLRLYLEPQPRVLHPLCQPNPRAATLQGAQIFFPPWAFKNSGPALAAEHRPGKEERPTMLVMLQAENLLERPLTHLRSWNVFLQQPTPQHMRLLQRL